MVTPLGQQAWSRLATRAEPVDFAALRKLSTILIISPHPDDETLGCGGLIATACDLGLRPRVAYLTDGAGSHNGSIAWPPTRLAAQRRREALNALAILGVPAMDTLFLDWPDGQPHAADEAAYDRTLRDLAAWARSFEPNSLWAPLAEESHCDHQAALALAMALRDGLAAPCALIEYIVWGWKDPDLAARHQADRVLALDCAGYIDRRRKALAQHATQLGALIGDATTAFALPPELAALTHRPIEIYLERGR